MKRIVTFLLLFVVFFTTQTTLAQAPEATATDAITALLNRIGGEGAADKFTIVINDELAEGGKDVFIITNDGSKPCIKGNNQLSVAAGINYYLNHYAHINLAWNNPKTNLVDATLPTPDGEDKHVCNTTYRYNFNSNAFSYSMAFWSWERWQQEIDWMALHGINAPLNIVGVDVVTRNFLKAIGTSDDVINNYIAGPAYLSWFSTNNLAKWGSAVNVTGAYMNGNPEWWYTRQEQLCKDMLQRMRELGMQPVLPGFSGQVPNDFSNENVAAGDILDNGMCKNSNHTRPDIVKPGTESYNKLAAVYYAELQNVMGVSELYNMSPFHEGTLPSGITNAECYPNIMAQLDAYHNNVDATVKESYNVNEQPKWFIQYYNGMPQTEAFAAMNDESYANRFVALDMNSDNASFAKYDSEYFSGRPYIFCMLNNYGGRNGLHGRLEATMNKYFDALALNNNLQGIGATPEGIENNSILYDMLFELPWMSARPNADEWLKDYTHARYGIENNDALAAMQTLKNSVWNCATDQAGPSEAVILGRPTWDLYKVSNWGVTALYYNPYDVLTAAEKLISIREQITSDDGKENYDYDMIDIVRQAMVDYAAELLPLINEMRKSGNTAEYRRLYELYLQLMLDLDNMLTYHENFNLAHWISQARNIAVEAGQGDNESNWLDWNARTLITVWSEGNTNMREYSNRCWAGLIKDYYYKRWAHFFEKRGNNIKSNYWYDEIDYPWTINFTGHNYSTVNTPTDISAAEKAASTFSKYFGKLKSNDGYFLFPMGVTRDALQSGVVPVINRGETNAIPLEIGKSVILTSFWIDLNQDGTQTSDEVLAVTNNKITIPANAEIGKTKAIVTYRDGTKITFNIIVNENITTARKVTVTAEEKRGTVTIEGTSQTEVESTEAVTITATANEKYTFSHWMRPDSSFVSNDNPYIYYGKEAATFTANFIEDKWETIEGEVDETIANEGKFIHKLTVAYKNREPETIYETTTAPTKIFNTIPKIVNVAQGSSFDIAWDNGNSDGLKKCYLRAYIDYDFDGEFDSTTELIQTIGTKGGENNAVCSGKINILLPYTSQLGITHIRLRFDDAFDSPENKGAKDESSCPVYDIAINVTEYANDASHINVVTNNNDWGSVKVYSSEVPASSNKTGIDVARGAKFTMEAIIDEGAEFLGWYDQYGRLVSNNLKQAMYAREDATYTAKIRRILTIDGWEMTFRTVPGDKIVTKRLENGVNPEDGKTYYIYADVKQTDESYIARYLYDNAGTLATTTDMPSETNGLWTCTINADGTYSFQNASGGYLANSGSYDLSIGSTPAQYSFAAAVHEGVSLLNATPGYTGSKYMVTKVDGTSFNHNSGARNDGQWCADYIFIEASKPDGVVLSKVLKSGEGDLVIPETVTVLGEECPIVGLDNDLFNYNKDLTAITLPKSMQFVSSKTALDAQLSGSGTATAGDVIILDIPDLYHDESWVMEMEVTNQQILTGWGTCLMATGEHPTLDQYIGGLQLYMQCPERAKDDSQIESRDRLIVKMNKQNTDALWFEDVYKQKSFKIIMDYDGNGGLTIKVQNSDGTYATTYEGPDYTEMKFEGVTLDPIRTICTDLAQGVDIPKVTIIREELPDPFRGCSNLDKIIVEEGNETFKSVDGCLYEIDVTDCVEENALSVPEGKDKGDDRRKLAKLIKDMDALSSQVASYNPASKTKIALQTTDSTATKEPFYIWSNAKDTEEGDIAHLVDGIKGDNNNFFHSNWHSVSTTEGYHYLEVDLYYDRVPSNLLQFAYHTRTNCGYDFPDTITVMGSWDKDQNFVDLYTVNSGLPQESNKTFESDVFESTQWFRYLRFKIKAERTYWHMGEFELFYCMPQATLFKMFEGYEEQGLTREFMVKCFKELISAKGVYENGTTKEEMQVAYDSLEAKYIPLLTLVNSILPFELTLYESEPKLYNIQVNRDFYGTTVLKYNGETSVVNISNIAANSTYQAWYFKNDVDGILIYPYNGDGKVLSADNNNNGGTKVWAVEKGSKAIYQWFIEKHYTEGVESGWYNILGDGKCFSNHGGSNPGTMGFYNDKNDGGSQFKFLPATFTNDNLLYYHLKDHIASHPDGSKIFEGKTVGLYNGGKAYREAYEAANALLAKLENTEEMDEVTNDECQEAIEALHKAEKNLSLNVADPAKFYVIKSVSNSEYCKGQYVHTFYHKTTHSGNGSTAYYDHRNLMFCESSNIAPRALAIFQFETTDTEGSYKMKNLHTGMYVKSFAGTHMGTASEAQNVNIAGFADGQVTLRVGNNAPMHAQHTNAVIVQWAASPGNASMWEIEELTDISEIYHTTTISDARYSTLYLNYPVEIPLGITAYNATTIEDHWLNIEKITDGIIPARTPVFLKGNPGTYVFQYAQEYDAATTIEESEKEFTLGGTLYNDYIGKEENQTFYVLSMKNGEVGLYKTLFTKNASGDDGDSHFLNHANKIYMKVQDSAESSQAAQIKFRFIDGNVSEIEDINIEESLPVIYDLQGRKINEITQPGIYIVNGNKVLVK